MPEQITCPHCGYTWEKRKATPKRCPACSHWINKPAPQK